jgi:hypothetical protein
MVITEEIVQKMNSISWLEENPVAEISVTPAGTTSDADQNEKEQKEATNDAVNEVTIEGTQQGIEPISDEK